MQRSQDADHVAPDGGIGVLQEAQNAVEGTGTDKVGALSGYGAKGPEHLDLGGRITDVAQEMPGKGAVNVGPAGNDGTDGFDEPPIGGRRIGTCLEEPVQHVAHRRRLPGGETGADLADDMDGPPALILDRIVKLPLHETQGA